MGLKPRAPRVDFSDVVCGWTEPVASIAREDGEIVSLRLSGAIGKRGRASVLELEHLEYLDIGQLRGVSQKWLGALARLPKLRVLDAWRTSFGDGAAAALADAPALEAIDVRNTKIGDDGLAALATIPTLRWIQLVVGQHIDCDRGIRALAAALGLEVLGVIRPSMTYQASWLQEETVAAALAAPQLRAVQLHGVLDRGEALAELPSAASLRDLGLGGNWHRGRRRWTRHLAAAAQIEILDLTYGMFRDPADLAPVAEMAGLEAVCVYGVELASGKLSEVGLGPRAVTELIDRGLLGSEQVRLPPDLAALRVE